MPAGHRSSRIQFRRWDAPAHQFKHKAFSSALVATVGEFLQAAHGPVRRTPEDYFLNISWKVKDEFEIRLAVF
jgi:hypothetical protein